MEITDAAVEAAEAAIIAAAYADWDYPEPGVEGCARVLARAATVAVLRELDRIYIEHDSSFEQLDVSALADEIEKEQ